MCVRDRLKMVKCKAWANTIVATKLAGTMTTKGQMKQILRVNFMESQAGENSESNAVNIHLYPVFKHT